jgi:HK97 gp10 family phage protein
MKMYESNVNKVKGYIDDWELKALEAIGYFIEGEAVLRCPVGQYFDGQEGGNLRRSIRHYVTKSEKSTTIGTPVDYAIYVEKGTPAHIIRPKNKKMLSWVPQSGQRIFARVVHHPGTKAQPFLTPAAEDNINKINEIARRVKFANGA